MRLFFETASQAGGFLTAMPVGFGAALCIDIGRSRGGAWQTALDLLLMLLCGLSMLLLVFALQEEGMRLYHLLGVACGALLYLRGTGCVYSACRAFWKRKRTGRAASRNSAHESRKE